MSSFRTSRLSRPRGAGMFALILLGSVLIGCGGSPAASASAAPTDATRPGASAAPEPTGTPAPPSGAPTVSAVCLPPDVLAAIGELASGDLEPSLPRDQLADAIEAIDPDQVDPSLFPYHDALVNALRKEEVRDSLGGMAQDFLEIADGRIGAC